ncbi:hypothetical protein [Arthrobacter sp. D5-1]|uniref:hypothetical protein n=1 Tax=Arthrobacter sp. D5-1 TaxID=1477518 RepID=UPI001A9A13F4|nr:hypothetical protein [Arthrobacter sp. D5-1]
MIHALTYVVAQEFDGIRESRGLRLTFKTQGLRRTCTDSQFAVGQLGVELATSLQARLSDLDAAEYLTDIPLGLDLSSSVLSRIPIHVLQQHYLIARADHVEMPDPGSADSPWEKVSRLQLTAIQEIK